MIRTGDCFTLQLHGKPHLCIAVQEQFPNEDNGMVLCVYICTVRNNTKYDRKTILEKGDHDFIKVQSYVKYNNVIIEDKEHLAKIICQKYKPISEDILNSIRSAFKQHHDQIRNKDYHLFIEWHKNQIYNHPDF